MVVEVITRWESGKPTTYSLDGGKTFITREGYKQKIGTLKRPLYNNAKQKISEPLERGIAS